MTNHAGFECPATFDGTDYHLTSWEGTETTSDHSVTTTANYDPTDVKCYEDVIGGTTKFEGSCKFFFDTDLKPYPQLRSGKVVNALVLKCDLTGSQISMKAFIKTLKVAPTNIDGVEEVDVTFRNKGKITYT